MTSAPDRTLMFRVVHAALRRDADRLVRAAPQATGPRDLVALRRWFDRVVACLDSHHRTEDTIWWPALSRSSTGFDAETDLVTEHQRLVGATAEVTSALTSDGLELQASAERWHRVLVDHLTHEEAAALPAIEAADVSTIEGAERASSREDSLRSVVFALPWVLDGLTDPERAALLEALPAPLRWMLGLFTRRYERVTLPVRRLAAESRPEPGSPNGVTASTSIAKPVALVRAHFADPAYHETQRVHADVTFTVVDHVGDVWCCRQQTRLRPFGRLRQIVELRPSDGDVVTTVVDGPMTGSELRFAFAVDGDRTRVTATARPEIGPAGRVVGRVVARAVQRGLARALEEDRVDLESGRYERYLAGRR